MPDYWQCFRISISLVVASSAPGLQRCSHIAAYSILLFLILLVGALALIVARGFSRKAFACLWLLWAGCIVTHPLLDALTDGGRGVTLLIPFARSRLKFPWRPIHTPQEHLTFLARAFVIRSSEIPFCAAAIVAGLSGLRWQTIQRNRERTPADPR